MSSILETDIQFLPGVGPRRGEALQKVGVSTFRDLIHYYPRRYLDRSTVTAMADIGQSDGPITVVGKITSVKNIPRRPPRFELRVVDEDGQSVRCVWFRGAAWVSRVFKVGELIAFHGTPQYYRDGYSFPHPDFDKLDADGPSLDTGRIIALYPGGTGLSKVGLTSRSFRKIIFGLFKQHGLEIQEALPDDFRIRYGLIAGNVARRAIHFPKSQDELEKARFRLKFEEFFFLQLLLAETRQTRQEVPTSVRLKGRGGKLKLFLEQLPFALTVAQQRAIDEILADTGDGHQMNRLVQGDVGSGKTVVAIAAMMHALDNGYQSAFMAPTEILAEQHFGSLTGYLDELGVQTRLLVGGQRKALRKEILADVANGTAHVVVGTHALIQEGVAFRRLGLSIIDEQHRFGVLQRATMFDKGDAPHVLLMTATPIPRSLAMTVFGDLDVTVIDEMPAGRKPIRTVLKEESDRASVYDFLREQIATGRQIYVVYPLVEESDKLALKDAESGFATLTAAFPDLTVDLIHGRMPWQQKEEVMSRFKGGDSQILVSTTVIEVGVDVPNAAVMVIEHAERFGLSQLHQLRGRVGRGPDQSYCILMADYPRTDVARQRLETMVETTDGFRISETDLQLRGAGDFFGTRQSGLPEFKIADVVNDAAILRLAREAAFSLVDVDPHLRDPEHAELREAYERSASGKIEMAGVG